MMAARWSAYDAEKMCFPSGCATKYRYPIGAGYSAAMMLESLGCVIGPGGSPGFK